ncbi:hypothetical protein CE91St61_07760 [Lachnospiraceae bacterium]|nr:hypothetical protein CE91St61_07760 [Lachnospiraceae bacterium]
MRRVSPGSRVLAKTRTDTVTIVPATKPARQNIRYLLNNLPDDPPFLYFHMYGPAAGT